MDSWLEENGHRRGAVLDLDQMWELAKTWYGERMTPEWRGRGARERQKAVDALGLTGDFWRME